jgi:hypothetical protein
VRPAMEGGASAGRRTRPGKSLRDPWARGRPCKGSGKASQEGQRWGVNRNRAATPRKYPELARAADTCLVRAPMRSPDQERKSVPVARNAKRQVPNARRRLVRRRASAMACGGRVCDAPRRLKRRRRNAAEMRLLRQAIREMARVVYEK